MKIQMIMKTKMIEFTRAAVVLGSFVAQSAMAASTITFETAGDYTNNFRSPFAGNQGLSQTGPTDLTNDWLACTNNGGTGGAFVAVYDTTPLDGATTRNLFSGSIRVEFDVSVADALSSFGVSLLNATNGATDSIMALCNLDNNSVTNETLRFWRDGANFSSSAGTQVGASVVGSSGLNLSPEATPVFGHVTFELLVGDVSPTVTLTVGDFSQTTTLYVNADIPSSYEVAFRVFDGSNTTLGTTKLDNIQITPIPEPSALALLGMGLGGMWLRRRR